MAQLGSSLSAETETLSNVLSLVEAFRAFDSDNDGAINAAELGGILSSLGYNASEQDVRAMMREGDANKDGLLSMEEFLEMNTKDMELGELANFLRTAFQAFEVEGDDALTAADLYEVMGEKPKGKETESGTAKKKCLQRETSAAEDQRRIRSRPIKLITLISKSRARMETKCFSGLREALK